MVQARPFLKCNQGHKLTAAPEKLCTQSKTGSTRSLDKDSSRKVHRKDYGAWTLTVAWAKAT
eukprot:scaffold206794_cov19-Tisochrysis_lutea.AAC.1